MRDLARHERVRNDADRVTAHREHGIGDNAHQPDVAAAEHKTDAAPRHLVRELFCSARILRSSPYARTAEDADAGRTVHTACLPFFTLTSLSPDLILMSCEHRECIRAW